MIRFLSYNYTYFMKYSDKHLFNEEMCKTIRLFNSCFIVYSLLERSDTSPIHPTDRAAYLAARELTLPATNGDPTMSLRVKSETLLPHNRSPKSNNISPGFVNIVATPLSEDRQRGDSISSPNRQYP